VVGGNMSHHNHQHLEPLGIETAGCPFGAMSEHHLAVNSL
jgi:hypothetical protein